MQAIDLEAMYASLLAEMDIFIGTGSSQKAEGVFAVMTRFICLYGVDGASLHHLFQKLVHIPNAYIYAQNILQLASPEGLFIFATARETSEAITRQKNQPVATPPPLFG